MNSTQKYVISILLPVLAISCQYTKQELQPDCALHLIPSTETVTDSLTQEWSNVLTFNINTLMPGKLQLSAVDSLRLSHVKHELHRKNFHFDAEDIARHNQFVLAYCPLLVLLDSLIAPEDQKQKRERLYQILEQYLDLVMTRIQPPETPKNQPTAPRISLVRIEPNISTMGPLEVPLSRQFLDGLLLPGHQITSREDEVISHRIKIHFSGGIVSSGVNLHRLEPGYVQVLLDGLMCLCKEEEQAALHLPMPTQYSSEANQKQVLASRLVELLQLQRELIYRIIEKCIA
ncbi:hypothetical protein [Flavilitoribacter nigricans]|uniref:Lipoprotein n=1 Tax=Flavilitoribacter nigricans (strain ATCC 23147 / DSM 23189 / NBRC 102662 / NCIMB 1420 / SS-2) TaxID=1122177 RepID=A0A2D0N0U2_FLAN2|nr:hypothetical protein [Flavilitoribacter nigricans]PHN01986.1 hypothetical protein CRP01_34335 [Flavilitoribacter nigricans DSM 23189 = NBRC 102662]